MTNKLFRNKKRLTDEIQKVHDELDTLEVYSEEYPKALKNLEVLYRIKEDNSIPIDKILALTGNLIGIALILNYEKLDVISTKALGFVLKGRV